MRIQFAFTIEKQEQHCYRCGNLPGRSRGFLYYRPRRRVTPAGAVRSAVSRVKYAYRDFTGYYDRSCGRCGVDSTAQWRRRAPAQPPRTLLGRAALFLSGRTVRHTLDDDESGLLHRLLGGSFPVRSLTGQPLGLELRSVSWEAGRLSRAVEVVSLLYAAGGGQPPRSRLLLEQAAAAKAIDRIRSPERELRAIVEVVQVHGARGQRERYAERGNVFRHWNLERLAVAPRRVVELNVGGAPVRVELAQWSDPQQVILARVLLRGVEVLAAAVDIPPARLMAMLKGLAP